MPSRTNCQTLSDHMRWSEIDKNKGPVTQIPKSGKHAQTAVGQKHKMSKSNTVGSLELS